MPKRKDIQKQVEISAKQLDKIVQGIIEPYCKDLDDYVSFIRTCLNN